MIAFEIIRSKSATIWIICILLFITQSQIPFYSIAWRFQSISWYFHRFDLLFDIFRNTLTSSFLILIIINQITIFIPRFLSLCRKSIVIISIWILFTFLHILIMIDRISNNKVNLVRMYLIILNYNNRNSCFILLACAPHDLNNHIFFEILFLWKYFLVCDNTPFESTKAII